MNHAATRSTERTVTKIYTKTGDRGETSLLGGRRVPKSDVRIESYGTVDELNAWLGLIADQDVPADAVQALRRQQAVLFVLGSHLAADPGTSRMKLPAIGDDAILFLEAEIDRMTATLPDLKTFILPGGHPAASYCHLARCVCRRAERRTVALAGTEVVDEKIIRYLNRLSDYLFTLARFVLAHFRIEAIPWTPGPEEKA